MSLNQVTLMGKLITDPEMIYTSNGLAITKFRMQTDAGDNRPSDLHSITVFGKQGDDALAGKVAQNFQKGARVLVQGRHSEKEFKANNGKIYLTCQVIAFSVNSVD